MEEKGDSWLAFTYLEIMRDFSNNDPLTGGYAIFGTEIENKGWRIGKISLNFEEFHFTFGSNIPKTISKHAIAELNMIFTLGRNKIDKILKSDIHYFQEWTE